MDDAYPNKSISLLNHTATDALQQRHGQESSKKNQQEDPQPDMHCMCISSCPPHFPTISTLCTLAIELYSMAKVHSVKLTRYYCHTYVHVMTSTVTYAHM